MNLFLPHGVKYWPVLVKTFAGVFMLRKQSPLFDGAYSNQFITKKLAQSFGISEIIAKNSIFGFKSNEIVNKESYVSDR
ncbi:hypothetical protein AL540_026800 [Vibrio harveyi]|nr:hypothetical protein AL540_026800 [Vibrio harveyi]